MDTEPLPHLPRRRLGGVALFALWAVAAAASVGVGFGAVHLVGKEVVDEIPRPLSGDTSAAPSPAGTASEPPASASPSPRRTTAAPAPTSARPPAATVRSYTVAGGTVGVACRGNSVTLRFATPRNGYAMEIGHRGPHEVEVEFEGTGGKSRFKAYCSGGRISTEIR